MSRNHRGSSGMLSPPVLRGHRQLDPVRRLHILKPRQSFGRVPPGTKPLVLQVEGVDGGRVVGGRGTGGCGTRRGDLSLSASMTREREIVRRFQQ